MTFAICHAQESVSVDMSEQYSFWKSLVSDKNLYFNYSYSSDLIDKEAPSSGCFAFMAVGQDLEKGVVLLKHVNVVKANSPIWIWGTHDVHSIPTFENLTDISEYAFDVTPEDGTNLLVGLASEETPIQLGDYVLSNKDNSVHAVTEDMAAKKTLGAGKCLLRLGAASRATLRIGMLDDDDEPTAVDAVCTREGQLIMYDPTKPSFDAQGRPVAPGQKGLHIQNGYKFYIK